MDFSTASEIWRIRQEMIVEFHIISHSRLFEFSQSCRYLLAKIEAAYSDELFWRRYGSALRRIRFDLAANPLSFDVASARASEVVRHLRDGLAHRARVYPDVAEDALAVVKAAESLVTSKDAPALEYLYFNQLLEPNDDARVGLVVREPRYLSGLENELAALDMDSVHALIPSRLKTNDRFARLIFVGPTAWFPDHVVASPRAPSLGFIHFDWLGPNLPPRSLMPGSGQDTWEAQGFAKPRFASMATETTADQPILDIVPSIDWSLILNQVGEAPPEGDGEFELVPARLCALQGGLAVLLRGHEGAETNVLSIDQKQVDTSWTPVAELVPGDFLLLRTTGGGDYVTELAWDFLGEMATEIQIAQAHWKRKLADAISTRGAGWISRESTANGATAANVGNVLAWASDQRIQPGKKGDFIALLKTLGLLSKANQYWRYGRLIRRARIRAGLHIRKLLLKQVQEADIAHLEQWGRADFQLPGRHGGTITALRLNELAPFVVEVPGHRIGVLHEDLEL